MPATSPRLCVVIDTEIEGVLNEIAQQKGIPVARAARELLQLGLEKHKGNAPAVTEEQLRAIVREEIGNQSKLTKTHVIDVVSAMCDAGWLVDLQMSTEQIVDELLNSYDLVEE